MFVLHTPANQSEAGAEGEAQRLLGHESHGHYLYLPLVCLWLFFSMLCLLCEAQVGTPPRLPVCTGFFPPASVCVSVRP